MVHILCLLVHKITVFFLSFFVPYRNDTDSGLRMKISAVPKSPLKKTTTTETTKPLQRPSKVTNENMNHRKTARNILSKKRRNDSTSNSSCCSACTESDDDSDSSSFCSKDKRVTKSVKQFTNPKTEKPNIRRAATTSRIINRKKPVTDSSDSDSDTSDDSSDSAPTEKRSSPTKPQQKFKNDLLKTVPGVSNQNLNADGASSSDMELPALVRAAIQRVESCSEGENSKTESISKTHYTSSLLRDFVTKSQMLGSTINNHIPPNKTDSKAADGKSNKKIDEIKSQEIDKTKKRRGRPRKQATTDVPPPPPPATNTSSGSPDSGIISTPQSPVPLNANKSSKKSTMTVAKKFDLATLDKNMYATERVLYPPRRQKKQSAQSLENLSKPESKKSAEKIDPEWRKIDINKKFRRPSECGYRSDTNTICSKLLAAQSGYTTDYGNINRRILSGYKSDYSCKSRRSGYKSDFSLKAKSCGYRSDCSTKHRRRIRRKRRTKTMSTKPTINDQDILMLAGLSLGHSDESSLDSSDKPQLTATTVATTKNPSLISSSHESGKTSLARISSSKSFGRDASSSVSERVAKRLNSMNFDNLSSSISSPLLQITSSIYKDGNSLKLDGMKAGLIRRRRSSAISHCSSHCSTNSRHPFRRRRRKRLKSTTDQISETNLAKLNLQVDLLSESFTSLCTIFAEKTVREKNVQTTKSTSSKRANKKRKTNQENNESVPTGTNPTTKRRNKKTVQTKSPDDHKLPLKKRHYLMTPGETPANKKGSTETADDKNSEHTSPDNEVEIVGKAITPKKRHLLQTPVDLNDVIDSTDATSNSTCKDLQEIQASVSISITNDTTAAGKSASQSKKNEVTRKKNRLEGLVSKISPQSNTTESSTKPAPPSKSTKTAPPISNHAQKTANASKVQSAKSVSTPKSQAKAAPAPKSTFSQIHEAKTARSTNRSKVDPNPPPGVFEPSVDIELQIPFTEIPIPMAQKSIDAIVEPIKIDSKATKTDAKAERVVEKLLHRTGAIQTLAKKKRKKPNRTGFPTLKKKKKPISKPQPAEIVEQSIKAIVVDTKQKTVVEKMPNKSKQTCDRVPTDGETAGTFIERNSKPRLSVISIERLQAKTKSTTATDEKTAIARKKSKNDKSSQKINKQNEATSDAELRVECKKSKIETDSKKELNDTKNVSNKRTKSHEVDAEQKKSTESVSSKRGASHERRNRSTNFDNHSPERHRQTFASAASSQKEKKNSHSTGDATSVKTITERNKLKVTKKIENDSEKINAKKSNETKLDRKRTVNGRILADKTVDDKMAGGELNKNGKKVRRDDTAKTVQMDKKKANKREADASVYPIESDKKRPRFDSTEKSPSKKTKSTSAKATVQETITDLADIVPVDEWIEKMTDDPLPLEENVNNLEKLTDLIPISKKPSSKPKKKYLVAGLFSNYYKEDRDLSHADKTQKSAADKNKAITDEPYTGSLLPMPFFEDYVMRTEIDFTLPWDLWHAHVNGKLTGRNIVHSWNFKKIRINIYADSVKPNQSSDLPQCSCKSEYECGDNCLNRLVYTECVPETCPCGDKCQNTKIQRHIVAPVERFMTPNKGWGVKTNNVIKKGTYILEYVGEVVTEREFKERMATLYTNDIHHYCLHLDGGLVIDGHRMGSDCRFVNHSCEPNCEMQKWSVNGLSRMALFALRDIRPGEELTYDYNFSLFNPADGQVCKCESQHCRGVIGGKSQRVRPIENKVIYS